jgi:hypothetical protein
MAKKPYYGGRRKPGGRRPAGPGFSWRMAKLERRVERLEGRETARTTKEVKRAKVQKVLEKYRLEAFKDRLKRGLLPRPRWGRRF